MPKKNALDSSAAKTTVSELAAEKEKQDVSPEGETSVKEEDQPEEKTTEEEAPPDETAEEEAPPGESSRKLAEAIEGLALWKDKYLRLAAEYDNYRKRTQKERENLYSGAIADTAARFLTVYDNLERALGQQTEDAAYYKGVELIQAGLLEIFEKLRIRPIDALGGPFDPELHEAVMHIQDDSDEQNVVAEVFQTGFARDEQVIRHAKVKVKN